MAASQWSAIPTTWRGRWRRSARPVSPACASPSSITSRSSRSSATKCCRASSAWASGKSEVVKSAVFAKVELREAEANSRSAPRASTRSRVLLGSNGGDIDLIKHAGPSELAHHDKRARRLRNRSENLAAAFDRIAQIADIRQIGRRLVDIGEASALLVESALDLVPGVKALAHEIAEMKNFSARRRVLVFRADAAEKEDSSGMRNGHHFGKEAFRPFAVIVSVLLKSAGAGPRFRRACRHERQQHQDSDLAKAAHRFSPSLKCVGMD